MTRSLCALLVALAVLPMAAQDNASDMKFRAIPDARNVRSYVERLSARPHHLGSPLRQTERGMDPGKVS